MIVTLSNCCMTEPYLSYTITFIKIWTLFSFETSWTKSDYELKITNTCLFYFLLTKMILKPLKKNHLHLSITFSYFQWKHYAILLFYDTILTESLPRKKCETIKWIISDIHMNLWRRWPTWNSPRLEWYYFCTALQ